LRVASLTSLAPPVGATGVAWLTRWQFRSTGDGGEESYRIFYVGANSTAGQTPTFFAGTGTSAAPTTGIPPGNGCVTTTPQNCKIFLYPNEKVETGRINTATGTISITVPLADIGGPVTGSILYSVTALTLATLATNLFSKMRMPRELSTMFSLRRACLVATSPMGMATSRANSTGTSISTLTDARTETRIMSSRLIEETGEISSQLESTPFASTALAVPT